MSDNVQVAVRVRPLVPSEIIKGCKNVLEFYKDLGQIRIGSSDKAFTYNYVFEPQDSQSEVYDKSVQPMLQNLYQGYNVTILAYGQTGSGKTHTMGTSYSLEGEMGVIPRAVHEIFSKIEATNSVNFTVNCSFLEIYQETVYDLLSDKPREQCVLDIREDINKGVMIPGLTHIQVSRADELFDKLMLGSRSRATGSTNMNSQSSRSHAIFTVNLRMQHKETGEEKSAKLHLVDLAGSERPKKTGAAGTTFKEGVNINRGLLVLGNVISALGDDKTLHGYIPYRDSNLTRLLKDSLGGNSITLMIACASPADYNMEETVSTLRYADRARKIQNKPIINQDPKAAEINLLKRTIQDLKLQIVGQGSHFVNSDGIINLKEENSRLQDRIRDLTCKLSLTLNDKTGLLEKLIILQNANDVLQQKIQKLKLEYEITLDNINASFGKNDQVSVQKSVADLKERIQLQFNEINTEQRKVEDEILTHEHKNMNNSAGQLKDEHEMSKDHENYTNKQLALNSELQEITKSLAIKEQLAREIQVNAQNLVDYNAMAENEAKILKLQQEKDELQKQLRNAHGPKMPDTARSKMHELESQIQELRKKVQEQAQLIKIKERDVKKINRLNGEILTMKQTKVKLIRKMREEADGYRTWKLQRERELAKLKQEDRKKQYQIVKMEVQHTKQQNVLRKKMEEAVALNKRLKDVLALRKATQDAKSVGKSEKIGSWLKQELDVRLHVIEAHATLAGLLEDRAMLQEQLHQLKENCNTSQDERLILSIEEDIELRSLQIQDLQQEVLDCNDEGKKIKLDNIQTMGDAKYAIKILLEQLDDIKKNEVSVKSKSLETHAFLSEWKQKYENMEKAMKIMEYKQAEDFSAAQKDYEEKTAVLLRHLRGVKVEGGDEELYDIQARKIEKLESVINELESELLQSRQRVEEFQEKWDAINMIKDSTHEENIIKLSPHTPPRKKHRGTKQNITFVVENQENILDHSIDADMDDLVKDPDWKNTPVGKYIMERRRQKSRSDENVPHTNKRTSEGGCSCARTNCSSRCGCRKGDRKCTSACKCASTCANKDFSISSDFNLVDKKPRLMP